MLNERVNEQKITKNLALQFVCDFVLTFVESRSNLIKVFEGLTSYKKFLSTKDSFQSWKRLSRTKNDFSFHR